MEAKGIEIGLTVVPVKTKNWNWDMSAFFTKTDAHITKLSKAYIPNGYTFYNNGPNVNIRMAEGDRARYGVFRQADFGEARVDPVLLKDICDRLVALRTDIEIWHKATS